MKMPKRKRSKEEEEEEDDEGNSTDCVNGHEVNNDDLDSDGITTVHTKRKRQLPFISSDTSTSSSKQKPITESADTNADRIPTATTTAAESIFACTLSKTGGKSIVSDENGEGKAAGQSPPKKRVRFDGVTVYYFHRSQGFTCVPTSGGNTLGMSGRHHSVCRFTLNERELEQKYEKRRYLSSLYWRQQRQVPINNNGAGDGIETPGASSFYSSSDSGQSAYYSNSEGTATSTNLTQGTSFNGMGERVDGEEEEDDDEDDDEDEDEDDDEDDEDDEEDPLEEGEDNGREERIEQPGCNESPANETVVATDFLAEQHNDRNKDSVRQIRPASVPIFEENYLQPLGSRERRSLLRESGIQVDTREKGDCHTIRVSRQICGCDCRGQCLPDTCSCARDNIKCQVDRPSFPCGCTKLDCKNPLGRVEFNPLRVRSHYLNTMMRLRMENRRQQELPSPQHTRFTNEDAYVDGEEGRQYSSSQMDGSSQRRPQSAPGFPSFHTLFSCSTSVHNQTTTICNDRSYWRLEATAPTIDHPTTTALEQSRNGYNVHHHHHLSQNWGCVYNGEEAAHQPAYCPPIDMDNLDRSVPENGCYDGKVAYESGTGSGERVQVDNDDRNHTPLYSLAALYTDQSRDHFSNHQNEESNHAHFSGSSSFQEYSSNSYSTYVSSFSSPATYPQGGGTANGVIGEQASAKSSNGEEEEKRHYINHMDGSVQNGNDHNSDSSMGSCTTPASPPPPELGAVLKKSICETALA